MVLKATVSYYKRSNKQRPPATYRAKRKGGKVVADIKLDPILKKHKDLRRGVLKHEKDEIRAWARGNTAPHRYASKREPRVTHRLGGERGFWREIERRERARARGMR